MDELRYQEIAKTLNVSVGTVMSRLFYGRKKLQSILEPHYKYTRKKPGIARIEDEAPRFGDGSDFNPDQE
jgi:hypothetical protein